MDIMHVNGLAFKARTATDWTLIGLSRSSVTTTIDIPEEIFGLKVTRVNANAFKGNHSIEAVNFPQSINCIETSAFENCTNLKYLFFKPGYEISNIQNRAFAGCSSLTSLTILKPIMIHEEAFLNCTNLRAVDGNFMKIANHAFDNCQLLHTVNLHSYVHIDTHAFDNCHRLSAINIIKDVSHSAEFVKYLQPQTAVHCCSDSKIADLAYEGCKIVTDMGLCKK